MSLTNPNSVITEERLNEFYQGILPYLGGMPEMIDNKIDRSNMYSTDEKIIGQWTDGKPIYQKTFVTTMPNCTKDGTTATKSIDVGASVEKYIKMEGEIFSTSSSSAKHIPWYVQTASGGSLLRTTVAGHDNTASTSSAKNKVIIGLDYTSYSNLACQITVQYTKTTDSAQSIGIDTDYSTTEKIVGTWIDGKPLYQKTINFGTLPNGTTDSPVSKEVSHNSRNLSLVTSITGTCYNSNYTDFANLPYYSAAKTHSGIALYASKTKVGARANYNASVYSGYITIQYTKTS